MQAQGVGTPRQRRLPIWRRLGWRLGASLLLLSALGILVSGFLQYRAQDRLLRQSLGSLLLNIARTGALLVDGDLHQAVVEAGRNDTPDYATLRGQLLEQARNLDHRLCPDQECSGPYGSSLGRGLPAGRVRGRADRGAPPPLS